MRSVLASVRPYLGLAILLGALSPFVLSSRSSGPLPAETTTTPIVSIHGEVLVTYKATTATAVQDVWPQPLQRGVQLDGMLRAATGELMAINGNPFESAWRAPSIGGMNLATGTFSAEDVDIALPAEGLAWVIGRTFNARQESSGSQRDSQGPQGRNWAQMSQPEIVFYDDATDLKDVLYLVLGADRFAEFKRVATSGTTFRGTNGAAGVFEFTDGGSGPDTYKLTDQQGNELTFIGFDSDAHGAAGQLWKIADPDGNVAYVGDSSSVATAIDYPNYTKGYNSNGSIKTAYDPSGRRFTYTYTTLDSVSRLTQVKAEKNTGSWVTVAQADYGYYTSETYGDPGDLKLVTLTTPLTDSGVSLVQKKYYRYWEGTYDSTTNPGYPHAIQYVVDYEGVRKFDWSDSTFDDDELTASSATLAPYASAYFEYDSSHRIRKAWFNGECGCSGANNGTFEFEYETNGSFSDTANAYDSGWKTRTVVKRPDLSYMTQYWDEVGQPLSQVITDADPDNTSPTPARWVTSVTRNSDGRVTTVATPANCTGYTHSTAAITASSSVGLIWDYTRENGAAATKGFVTKRRYREGTSGTLYYDKEWVYDYTDQTNKAMAGETYVIRPGLSRTYRYPTKTSTASTDSPEEYDPAWDGTAVLAMKSNQVTDDTITTGNNGSGSANSLTPYFRLDGTKSYEKAPDGIISYWAYTDGLLTTSIQDADTGQLSDEPAGLTSTSGALHLVTTYSYDAQGRLDLVTQPDGRKIKHYYSKLADGRLVSLSYNDFETTPKFYGPVQYTVTNQAGNAEVEATVALTSNESTTALTGHVDETDADPITAMDLGTVAQMTTEVYNESGGTVKESRLYFLVPSSGAGTDGTNYDPTVFGYDDNGRRQRVKEAHGTITRTVLDKLGRTTSRWMGTNDHSFSGGEASGTDNMVKVEELEYDGNDDDGNGYLTKRTAFIQDSTTGQRVTTYSNDALGRVLLETNPTAPHAFHKYDNEGRRLGTGLFSSTANITVSSDDPTTKTTDRVALTESFYDEIGQLWKAKRHNIASNGTSADSLDHLYWRDAAGRVIKEDGPQLLKTFYDRLGRQTHRFVIAEDDDTVYANMDDVTNDLVLEEHQTVYASGNSDDVVLTVRIDRKHNDWGGINPSKGALDNNADNDSLLVTAGNLKGRAQITCHWYDRFGRKTDEAFYGTNNGSNLNRSGLSVPARSDTELVTSYAYDTDGTLQSVTDPRGLVMRTEYDDAERTTKEIRNYSASVNSGNPANPDDNQTVVYEYTDGLRTKIKADMPSGETDQETVYIFGTTKGTPSAMKVASGHILRAVKYPDSTNTGTTSANIDSDSSDVVSYAYNAQGQVTYQKDQAGNVTEMDFDDSGRETHRRVTTLATGFDGAVRRISRTYNNLHRPDLVTQYDNSTVGSGSVTDEVKYTYDGWGGITSFKQDKDSAVGGSGYYEVQYAYAKATTGRNAIRRSSMTLPSGKAITIDYTKDKDGSISRVSKLKDGSTTLCKYEYLGAGRVVGSIYSEPAISCNEFSTTDNSYTDYLDRFNRIFKNRWATDLATPKNFYDADISYDRNSNITWVEDNVHSGFDVKYTMDDLDRLSDAEEGTRSGSSIATRKRHQTWTTLTQTGNWSRAKLDLDGDDNWNETNEYDDSRTHNAVNELTAQDTDSNGTNNYSLSYDADGSLTDDGKDYKYEYDAFARLRKVKTQASAMVAEYRYNGLGFMIGVHEDTQEDGDLDASDVWFYPAYDERWREVARYRESDTAPKEEFVNALAGLDGRGGSSYINDVVCRNRDANTGWTAASDGTLEERYYLCPNWRGDVSALVTSGRQLHEWGKYSPYGVPNSRPGADTDSDGDCDSSDATQIQTWIDTSAYDVRGDVDLDGDVDSTDKTLAQGSPLSGNSLGWGVLTDDAFRSRLGWQGAPKVTTSYHLRKRHHPLHQGRWSTRDPQRYADSSNLYESLGSAPLRFVDPRGTIRVTKLEEGHNDCPQCHHYCVHELQAETPSASLGHVASATSGAPRHEYDGLFFQLIRFQRLLIDCDGTLTFYDHIEFLEKIALCNMTGKLTDTLEGAGQREGHLLWTAETYYYASNHPDYDTVNDWDQWGYIPIIDHSYAGGKSVAINIGGGTAAPASSLDDLLGQLTAPPTEGPVYRSLYLNWECCPQAPEKYCRGGCTP